MKFAMFVLLCCVVAFASAAPQLFYGGWPGIAPVARTVVAGPTVVNGAAGLPGVIAPGYIGTAFI